MDEISRRDFVKQSGQVATGGVVVAAVAANALSAAAALDDLRNKLIAALGDLFVPSAPSDPGYKDLERYGITDYVLKSLPVESATLEQFNETARQFFGGASFLELDPKQKEQYLAFILDAEKIADANTRRQLVGLYRVARTRILNVYYQNFPEHEVKHNPDGTIVSKPGDTHQIPIPIQSRS